MSDPWETLKLLADPTRLRLIRLLREEELSVAELQDILGMGQSRISSHLALLRGGDLVRDRKEGKRTYYSLNDRLAVSGRSMIDAACRSVEGQAETEEDDRNLERILEQRRRHAERYFNEVAGRLGKNYCPGRSWEAIGHFLLHLTPSIEIADLGAGEGILSQLLARRAKRVTCVDNSPKMVEIGAQLAREQGLENLVYRLGDIEAVPMDDASVDLVFLSQALHHARHPHKAIAEAVRILRPGGQLLVIDLKEHSFEQARELYADVWLGFSENALYRFLREAGLQQIEVATVAREEREPFFETLLASAVKGPGASSVDAPGRL